MPEKKGFRQMMRNGYLFLPSPWQKEASEGVCEACKQKRQKEVEKSKEAELFHSHLQRKRKGTLIEKRGRASLTRN